MLGLLRRALANLALWLMPMAAWAQAAPADSGGGADMQSAFQEQLNHIRQHIIDLAEAVHSLPAQFDQATLIWTLEFENNETLLILIYIAGFLAVGFLAQWLYWRPTRAVRQRIINAPAFTTGERLKLLLMRLAYNGLALGFFVLGSVGAFLAFSWPPLVKLLVLTYLFVFVIYRAVEIVLIILLAPWVPKLRMVPVDDAAARALHRWLLNATLVIAFGLLTASLLPLFSFAPATARLLRLLTGLVLALMAITSVWRLRQRIAAAMRGRGPAAIDPVAANVARHLLIELWPHLTTFYIVLLWLSWAMGFFRIAGTLLIIGLMVLARIVLRGIVFGHFGPPAQDEDTKLERPYAPVIARFLRMVVVIVALAALAATWGVGIDALFGGEQAPVFRAVFNVIVALLLADALWHMARTSIDVSLSRQGDAGSAHARLATLLPLMRKALFVALLVVVGMIVLSAVGVDIGPLLAGAGVLGIAIGFGAQTLVKDIVSGVFFLIDDAFRVGEYVEIGKLKGTVEGISIRSLRLRHHRGPVHTIPFGEMRALTNYSRDWVIDKFQFGVTYDSDLDKVKKIIKQIGKELSADPVHGPKFLEPLKSQGVEKLGDYSIDIRVKFKVRPGDQFTLRREAFKRIKRAFDANGIKFAFPTVSVQGGGEAAAASLALQKPAPAKADDAEI